MELENANESGDLRSDLAAAIEQAETAAPPPAEPSSPPAGEPALPAPESEAAAAERARDEKGRFAKQEKAAEAAPAKEPEKAAPTEAAPAKEPEKPAEPVKAPASFKAMAREEWGKVPPAVQQEVIRRERETAIALEQSAEARQGYQRFRETVAPYEPMLRSQGVEPMQAVQSLLQTAAALATSPVQQRAAILAGLIQTYLPGKESLEVLDNALTGMLQGRPAQAVQPQAPRDPRVDEIYNAIQQAREQQARTLEQQAAEGLREVQANEFFEDVKLIMADLLDVAAKQGIALSAGEAYNRATLLHPDVSKVLEQRRAVQQAANPQGSTARARAAASSVRGSPVAPLPGAQPEDLRSVLEAAFDRAGR